MNKTSYKSTFMDNARFIQWVMSLKLCKTTLFFKRHRCRTDSSQSRLPVLWTTKKILSNLCLWVHLPQIFWWIKAIKKIIITHTIRFLRKTNIQNHLIFIKKTQHNRTKLGFRNTWDISLMLKSRIKFLKICNMINLDKLILRFLHRWTKILYKDKSNH